MKKQFLLFLCAFSFLTFGANEAEDEVQQALTKEILSRMESLLLNTSAYQYTQEDMNFLVGCDDWLIEYLTLRKNQGQPIDVNKIRDQFGKSLLDNYVSYGSLNGVQALLDLGADPNLANLNNEISLFYTVDQCDQEKAELLLQAGADILHEDNAKYTVVDLAEQYCPQMSDYLQLFYNAEYEYNVKAEAETAPHVLRPIKRSRLSAESAGLPPLRIKKPRLMNVTSASTSFADEQDSLSDELPSSKNSSPLIPSPSPLLARSEEPTSFVEQESGPLFRPIELAPLSMQQREENQENEELLQRLEDRGLFDFEEPV